MTLARYIMSVELSGMKVAIMVGSKPLKPNELTLEQLNSESWEEKVKPVNRVDGIYKIVYLLEDV